LTDVNIHPLPPDYEFEGYRILRVLGAGGFGIVYLAEEIAAGRKVAIKEYLPQGFAARMVDGRNVRPVSASSKSQFNWGLDRFRREAQTLAAFKHPNIVSVYRCFEAHGTAYLVMQYVKGKSLEALLAGGETLTASEIDEVIFPILDGLEVMHKARYLHRDIKPDNIYIRRDGRPVLLGFGAASQTFGSETKTTAAVSDGYAPFEQYDAKGEQGPWTDVYALGAVLYRCIAGQAPPPAPDRIAARQRSRADPMRPVRWFAQGHYGANLLSAVERALGVTREERPQTVAELRSLLGGVPAAGASARRATPAAVPSPEAHEASARGRGNPSPVASSATAPLGNLTLIAALATAIIVAGGAAAYVAIRSSPLGILEALVLGFVEGLTEFLPVSSTAHLLLGGALIGFDSPNRTFEVMIQLGAILALLFAYSGRLWRIFGSLGSDAGARRFVIGVLLAFLPAVLVGLFIGKYVEALLYQLWIPCVTLIVGGFILLVVDRIRFTPREKDAQRFPVWMALAIGVCQCLAMIPGVSRSGATIVGALFLGADKRSAAEFSFFLAMPTMAGAFAYKLYKDYAKLTFDQGGLIVIGFVAAFVAALIVVRVFLDFVARNGFSLFAYWRIAVGTVGLVALAIYGTK
jgi:undecaprenyl-diphosphatase